MGFSEGGWMSGKTITKKMTKEETTLWENVSGKGKKFILDEKGSLQLTLTGKPIGENHRINAFKKEK